MYDNSHQKTPSPIPTLMIALGLFIAIPYAQAQDHGSFKHASGESDAHGHAPEQTAEPNLEPNQGKISVSAGVDLTSAYFFRGIIQEDQGLITQPWLDATVSLSDNTSLTFGIWNSFHDAQSAATNNGTGPDSWYEADLYVSLAHQASDQMELSLGYTALTSPNDAFGTVHEVSLGMSYDDSSEHESGWQPHVLIVFETDGQSDAGANEGTYLELGVEPSCTFIDRQVNPVTLSIPMTVGLSLGDYYEDPNSVGLADDSNFGYFDIGMVFTMPLTEISADYGEWEVSFGVHYLKLTETTEALNSDQKGDEVIFTFGISMGY